MLLGAGRGEVQGEEPPLFAESLSRPVMKAVSGSDPSVVQAWPARVTLLVDAYTGYNKVTISEGRTRAGCLAHARRKLFEAKDAAHFGDLDCGWPVDRFRRWATDLMVDQLTGPDQSSSYSP